MLDSSGPWRLGEETQRRVNRQWALAPLSHAAHSPSDHPRYWTEPSGRLLGHPQDRGCTPQTPGHPCLGPHTSSLLDHTAQGFQITDCLNYLSKVLQPMRE